MVDAATAGALLFLAAAFSTIFCAAVNCYTYRIAYPLWRSVSKADFPVLHAEYLRRLTPVITLPHVVMFFSSGALIWWRPIWLGRLDAVGLFTLDAAVVVVSAFAAGPIHDRFTREREIDEAAFRRLMGISALRVSLMLTASALLGKIVLAAVR